MGDRSTCPACISNETWDHAQKENEGVVIDAASANENGFIVGFAIAVSGLADVSDFCAFHLPEVHKQLRRAREGLRLLGRDTLEKKQPS